MNIHSMRIIRILAVAMTLCVGSRAMAQSVEIDYNHPVKYYVGGVSVEGTHYFGQDQILQLTGLQKGMELTVPGDDISSIVNRLFLQRYFEDVAITIDHLSESGDSAYFKIKIVERPRVSDWTFTGVRSGEKKELLERLHLRRGCGVVFAGGLGFVILFGRGARGILCDFGMRLAHGSNLRKMTAALWPPNPRLKFNAVVMSAFLAVHGT